jgi:hypothetical protein
MAPLPVKPQIRANPRGAVLILILPWIAILVWKIKSAMTIMAGTLPCAGIFRQVSIESPAPVH